MIKTDCTGCRYVEGSAKEEPCWSCLGPGGERNRYERRDEPTVAIPNPVPGEVVVVSSVSQEPSSIAYCSLCGAVFPVYARLLNGACAECRTLDALVRQHPGRARKILRNILKEALKDD